jgi:hypothetical protein
MKMRQLKKLIGIGSEWNTDMLIPEVLHSTVIQLVDRKLVLKNLPGFWMDNDLVGAPGDTKTYQRSLEDVMEPTETAPGAAAPEAEEPYTGEITLKVRKLTFKPAIEKEMIEDSKFNEMARQMNRATFKMARAIDEAAGRGMTMESGAFPITGMNCQTLLDRQATVVASGLTMPDDILKMISALEKNEGKATDIIMHPNFYPGIRATEWFKNVSNPPVDSITGPAGPNGLVGEGYGLRWWQSTSLAYSGTRLAGSGIVLMWDAGQSPFVFLNKRDVTIENVNDVDRDIVAAKFSTRFNVMNVQPSAVVWVTGVYSTYYRTVADRVF